MIRKRPILKTIVHNNAWLIGSIPSSQNSAYGFYMARTKGMATAAISKFENSWATKVTTKVTTVASSQSKKSAKSLK